MKLKFLTQAILALTILVGLTACNNDDEVKLANLNVTLNVESSFSGISIEDISIVITNTSDNSEQTALTDANGVASFIDLAPGTYNVTSSIDLTSEEAGASCGYYEAMTLNAVENNLLLMGGIDTPCSITLDGKPSSSLVISELYFNGTMTDWLFYKSQYIELYNNSSEVVYADGLYVASLAPGTTGSSANDIPLALDLTEKVYARKIMRVPGNGSEFPVQPGETFLIALNAVDYSNGGTSTNVNLSNANIETYATSWMEGSGRTGSFDDIDNIDVPNMECIYLALETGWYTLDPIAPSIAIFRNESFTIDLVTDPTAGDPVEIFKKYATISVDDIIDGVDIMLNAEKGNFKRLPTSIDAGFNYIDAYFSAKSVKRVEEKVIDGTGRRILKDTNNTTNDFEVTDTPTPGAF